MWENEQAPAKQEKQILRKQGLFRVRKNQHPNMSLRRQECECVGRSRVFPEGPEERIGWALAMGRISRNEKEGKSLEKMRMREMIGA